MRPLRLDDDDGALDGGSPDLRFLLGDRGATFARRRFEPFRATLSPLFYPAFLLEPLREPVDVDERALVEHLRLRRYATNSGTAAGRSRSEAQLHALLEVIERDAIGMLFLRTIMAARPQPAVRIAAEHLPESLATVCAVAADETGLRLQLFDASSDIDVPVVLCSLAEAGDGRAYFGSGASLSFSYAVERAVLEAVQTVHIVRHLGGVLPHSPMGRSGYTSNFQRCFLDAGHFAPIRGAIDRELATIRSNADEPPQTIEAQLSRLVIQLERLGIDVFWRCLEHSPSYVVQVVAPRLERFHLVSYGIPVVPGGRGRSLLSMR